MESPNVVTKVQVNLNLKFNCGCGFTSNDERESSLHVKDTGHKITVSGMLTKANFS